jgi:hypothetical protein
VAAKSSGPLSVPGNGILVMGADTLLNWAQFGTVLAQVEVDGDECATDGNRIVVRRARTIRLVPGWTDEAILSWGFECVDRAIRIHLACALDSANFHKLSGHLAGIERIADPLAANRIIGDLERIGDHDIDPLSWLRRAVDGAIKAASWVAAPALPDPADQEVEDDAEEEEEDSDEPLDDRENGDGDGPDAPHYTETAAWWEARRLADEERAAKYAAKAARWACYCAAECVAVGATSKVQSDSYSEAATEAQDAEYRFQAERFAEVVGV